MYSLPGKNSIAFFRKRFAPDKGMLVPGEGKTSFYGEKRFSLPPNPHPFSRKRAFRREGSAPSLHPPAAETSAPGVTARRPSGTRRTANKPRGENGVVRIRTESYGDGLEGATLSVLIRNSALSRRRYDEDSDADAGKNQSTAATLGTKRRIKSKRPVFPVRSA